MTAFRDGWVCPSCFTPNRASDGRCYSCRKSPWAKPAAQVSGPSAQPGPAAPADSWQRPMGRGADQERVIPAVFTALVTPVGVLFVIQGFLGMLVGVLYVAIGILLMVANADSVMGILLFLACALQFVVSWLYWKLGKKILAGRRWAWVVGCLLSSAPFLALFGILLVRPDFMSVVPFTYDAIRLLLIFPGYMTVALALAAIADIVIRGHYRRREGRAARQAAASQALAGG